ncbi:MAG: TIGR04283 family arsenosugar biosynthesis glycosyltransferase [Desulfomonile tiedjei]|nr:TIGR04283 family arsenosugar biosynthesis glycosyltransferase [Desulfomonile tiedjei]
MGVEREDFSHGALSELQVTSDGGKRSRRDRVIVFTRYPEPGRTKTRLIPILGAEGAANLQRSMAEHAIERIRLVCQVHPVEVEVRYEGGSLLQMSGWLGQDLSYREQHAGDLGTRMRLAFEEAFREGAGQVILVGTDCPGISAGLLERSFRELRAHDLVLGPATDGGYYLMGLKRLTPELFSGVPWGTSTVLATTLELARKSSLSTHLVDELTDVDRVEDLEVWQRESLHHAENDARDRGWADGISVIVPTLNEVERLASTVASIGTADHTEIIVVDGGSSDGTADAARALGLRVIESSRGRAVQMNLGASEARGAILLFLHSDTSLPKDWADHVRTLLARPRTAAGAFALRLDGRMRGLRSIERLANFRSERLQLPYGDQGIFLRADTFRSAGGFPELPIMEDFVFMRNLRRLGRIRIAQAAVLTSARRWQSRGVWRNTLLNQAIVLGYMLGVPPAVLARLAGRDGRGLAP